jgi:hypothetical protein
VRRGAAVAALALLAAGCGGGPTGVRGIEHPDLSGSWSYTATNVRHPSAPAGAYCTITGLTLHLGPWRYTGFFGRTEGGVIECHGAYAELGGPLPTYAVSRGGKVEHHIAFEIGNPSWRHEGFISEAADSMHGTFVLRHGEIHMQGEFETVRNVLP